ARHQDEERQPRFRHPPAQSRPAHRRGRRQCAARPAAAGDRGGAYRGVRREAVGGGAAVRGAAMSIGLIVAADEPAIFFSGVEAAERWMEPIDVLNGIYTAAYGPAGEPYEIVAGESSVSISRIPDAPDRPDELRAVLLSLFEAISQTVRPDESLAALLARCQPIDPSP